MQSYKRPSMLHAVLCTIAGVFNLMALLLMIAARNTNVGPAVLFAAATILLGIAAIGNWRLFAKRYVEYKVSQKLGEKGD
jgi:fucose 4-O-acetylase-like acetyltransferase